MTVDPGVTHTVSHGTDGKQIDVYLPAAGGGDDVPTVLLWHGRGPDERDMLGPLARQVVRRGLIALVPDWRSDAPDGGRRHLLESLEFAREHVPGYGGRSDRIVLAGWSAGAPAAMGVALRPELVGGWRPMAVVGIASRYDWPARTTGSRPLDDLAATTAAPVPVWLVHGSADSIMESRYSREFALALKDRGWPVQLEEPATDHAGAALTEYDPELGRCRAARSSHAVEGGLLTARVLARAAGLADASPGVDSR
ncbi:alpha/beta hydrolase [Streptantibioticus ferralitis]|uniref:Alpha/beta hydrolase n=1 Tax=Streptantibioticus ferralitis TaxID=236510 RepID=A0ABT5YVZ8_9ACTN|nr:alpha/beta hydrolase [Streptantibioticus ferralitis]MDF2255695.1 alpha/beta hydrolase [Streptantibioticus ferralitis]